MSNRLIAKAAVLLLFISILARLLGFVREQVIAAYFGTSMLTDAYVMGLTLPNLVYVVIGGALATAFVPVIIELLSAGKQAEAERTASSVLNITVLALLIITAAGIVSSPFLVRFIAVGFTGKALSLTVLMTQLLFPTTVFLTIAGLAGGLLNSMRHFAAPALGSVVYSIVVIIGMLVCTKQFGIAGLAMSTVVATLAQIIIQLPVIKAKGFKYSPTAFDLKDPGVRKVGRLMLPAMLGTSVAQIYVTIDRILASMLATGSISALNFASKLTMLPFNLFVITVNTAVFPFLSELAAKKQYKEMGETTGFGLILISLFTLPSAVGIGVLATPLVRVLFEHGAFNAESTRMTVFAMEFFAVGLFAQGAYNVLNRGFFALQDTKTPVFISLFVVFLNLAFSLLLIGPLKHGGLALANSLASTCNMFLAYWFLRRRIPLPDKSILVSIGKLLLASACMGIAVFASDRALAVYLGTGSFTAEVLHLSLCILIGIGVYAGAVMLLKIEAVEAYKHRLLKKKNRNSGGEAA